MEDLSELGSSSYIQTSFMPHIKKCEWECKEKTSTTSIASHLRTKHRIIDGEIISPLLKDNDQAKTQKITNHFLDWLIDDMQAFNLVDNLKFHKFIYELNPNYSVPCKNSLNKKMCEFVSIGKNNLIELIKNSMDTFFFTMDLWTQDHKSYIGITIHWMTPNFEIKQALLTIETFKYPHSGDNIEDCLRKEFQKWNITQKLFGGTTDNDSAMVKVLQQLNINHVHCVAHTMQLAIKDGLKNVKDLIDMMKKLNSFIVDRDKYRDLLKLTFRKVNKTENEVLNPVASDTDTQKLLQDSNRATRIDGETLKKLIPSSDNWIALDELLLLLRPFVDATNLTSVCNSILTSLNKHWEILDELGCIASFLDPRFKYLSFLTTEQRENIKCNLKKQIESLESPLQSCLNSSTSVTLTTTISSNHSMFIDYFNQNLSSQHIPSSVDIEISLYLQLPPLLYHYM
ncbi:12817_t:CDS:2 [Cetraspora pellucida]|uniref:12817_t:CDS:1 n=1 Tax=Cetraspora pellucida TaxID=1433469 RepID=A0A9N9B223_9GLOM|nr:12817_t:CDS:2 [Cetraspora pellucida]